MKSSMVTRKKFLGRMALATLAAPLLNCREDQDQSRLYAVGAERLKRKTLVVGAGISGLSAAARLKQAGFAPVVLEARNRIGGRILTDRSLGMPVDLGASWIHGPDGNPISNLARKFQAATAVTDFNSDSAFDATGKPLTDRFASSMEKIIAGLHKEASAYSEKQNRDLSVEAAMRAIVQQWNRREENALDDDKLRYLEYYLTGIETEYGENVERLSMWYFEADEAFKGNDVIFPRGYDQIVEGLARGLDIKTGQIVKRIEYGNSGVRIHTNKEVFAADQAIITLPVGVLKKDQVAFVPELPASKRKAIDRLGMGVLNKVALLFPAGGTWPIKTHFMTYIPAEKRNFTEFLNMRSFGPHNILVALTGGDFARSTGKGLPGAQSAITAILRKCFGANFPGAVAGRITAWHTDPFCYGSYPHLPVGATPADYSELGRSVMGRLFFAGDGTNKNYPSTVHGAYLSGQRAATEIETLA